VDLADFDGLQRTEFAGRGVNDILTDRGACRRPRDERAMACGQQDGERGPSQALCRQAFVPRLSEFYGIVIYMYWRDHAPPHFHAIYGGDEAQVRIQDGTILEGSLPRVAERLVREWASLRRSELMEDWERAQVPEALLPIEPLQ